MMPATVVVSSTIFPDLELQAQARRVPAGLDSRLEQTIQTVGSLSALGYKNILILDNSGSRWRAGVEKLLQPAQVHLFTHFQFQNKGLSELFLLLSGLQLLPPDHPIVKLSGRYIATRRLEAELGSHDLVAHDARVCGKRLRGVSTISYAFSGRGIYETFLRQALRELYAYQSRITGPQSFMRVMLNALNIRRDFSYENPILSLEAACALALRRGTYSIHWVDNLGVTGVSGETGQITRC